MEKVNVYSASDYCGLKAGRYEFYYGYEEVDKDDNWCFVAKVGGVELLRTPIKYKGDKLTVVLLKGIGMFLKDR